MTIASPTTPVPVDGPSSRTMRDRLMALISEQVDAWSARGVRRTLGELQAINDPSISDVEGGRRAAGFARWYAGATAAERRDAWLLMSEQFAPDASGIEQARLAYEASLGTPGEAGAEVALRRAVSAPRTRLLQRFASFPEGMRFLIDLRAELLPVLRAEPRLLALEAELEQLLSTWLDVGFLELRRITWDSPASLIEKLIRYEAVHDIRDWMDARNRLDEDRRCYGFFHPRLPNEPLIFVEVALLQDMAATIPPLLDEHAALADPEKAHTAIFYSISNTQPGLKGVSFGDSLIKRVVESLLEDFPRLRTFATLSPIPGLRSWVRRNADSLMQGLPRGLARSLAQELEREADETDGAAMLRLLDRHGTTLSEKSAARAWLMRAAALYLGKPDERARPRDAVARFHLGNGARIERLNWAGDPSERGIAQSWGLMVNYLYDIRKLDRHRSMLAEGRIAMSGTIESLM